MGNRRIGRKRLESVLKKLNATTQDTAGSRSGLNAFDMPAYELQPSKYFGVFDDFIRVTAAQAGTVNDDMAAGAGAYEGAIWSSNIAGTSDAIAIDSTKTGGVVKFTLGSSGGDDVNMSALSAGFTLDASSARKIWYECRLQADDVSGMGFFVGLASTEGAEEESIIDSLEDGIGFMCTTGASPDIKSIAAIGNSETQTDTTIDIADGTWVTLSFYFDGSTAHYYVNGVKRVSSGLTLPIDGTIIFPAIEFTAIGGSQDVTYVDYVRICMER